MITPRGRCGGSADLKLFEDEADVGLVDDASQDVETHQLGRGRIRHAHEKVLDEGRERTLARAGAFPQTWCVCRIVNTRNERRKR